MIENQVFNEYVEKFKKLPLDRKKELTIEEIKKIIGFLITLKKYSGLSEDIMLNREILDAKGASTEEDFVEAIFVYAHVIEETLAEYLQKNINY